MTEKLYFVHKTILVEQVLEEHGLTIGSVLMTFVYQFRLFKVSIFFN